VRPAPGFTLIELLVVMVIMGVTLGLASLSVLPGRQQSLHGEAERIALLLQMARDEAIVRNRQVAFEAGPDGYRFLVRNDSRWQPITGDDLLRERAFKHGPLLLTVEPATGVAPPPLSIIFGREPVDKPFLLTLADAERRVAIRADGIGHFTVE
jgi:general secretion pathway protein H